MNRTDTYAGQVRPFGLAIALIMLAVGVWRVLAADAHAWYWIAGALALTAATVLFPQAWLPVLRVWMPFAHALGRLNTRILLGAVFFLMIVPMGWVLRLLGHDPLRLRRRAAAGEWVERGKDWEPSSFKDQF